MKLESFAVYDDKSAAYMTPFFNLKPAEAIRAFSDAVNNPEHRFRAHPADYTLFHIGSYTDETGLLEPITPKSLGNGVEFISPDLNPFHQGPPNVETSEQPSTLRTSPQG